MLDVVRWGGRLLCCLAPAYCFAQTSPTPWPVESTEAVEFSENIAETPLDDVVPRQIIPERQTLAYAPLRESDVLWERRVWRVVDVREKMNLPFAYPEMPFFTLLAEAAQRGDLPVYSTENDRFTKRLDIASLRGLLSKVDTVMVFNPTTYEEEIKVIQNDIDHGDVKRFRIKEIWYFDKQTSTMKVRILGIAPLLDVKDNDGNFRYEAPLFWVNYAQARPLLGQHAVFLPGGNTRATVSWEDVFEMRYFASHIYKAANIHDRRLEDYLTGVDRLHEAERIRHELINFEHDLWQY